MNTYRIYYKKNGKTYDYGTFKGSFKEIEAKIASLNKRFSDRNFYWAA